MIFKDQIDIEVPKDDSASEGEKMLLYWLIRELEPKVVVETGTHKGLATLYMAHALYDNEQGHITTYDPFEWNQIGNFAKFPELQDYITYKREPGIALVEEQIDFAFIDGFHGFKDAYDELKVLLPRLSKTAVVVLHDCWYEKEGVRGTGVNEAAEIAGLQTIWLPTTNAMRIYSKHPENPTDRNDL